MFSVILIQFPHWTNTALRCPQCKMMNRALCTLYVSRDLIHVSVNKAGKSSIHDLENTKDVEDMVPALKGWRASWGARTGNIREFMRLCEVPGNQQ